MQSNFVLILNKACVYLRIAKTMSKIFQFVSHLWPAWRCVCDLRWITKNITIKEPDPLERMMKRAMFMRGQCLYKAWCPLNWNFGGYTLTYFKKHTHLMAQACIGQQHSLQLDAGLFTKKALANIFNRTSQQIKLVSKTPKYEKILAIHRILKIHLQPKQYLEKKRKSCRKYEKTKEVCKFL